MFMEEPSRHTLTTGDIWRFRDGLAALEYSRFRSDEREILVIRSPSCLVSLVDDLELMVEMIDVGDALGLDEAYLIGDENYEAVAPEIMTNIASARLRIEKGYLEKYGPILGKEYSSKEFIDPKDPLELLRLIVRVPLKESEYISTPLSEIISHVYVPNDISIVYLMLEDSYRRIIKDDIVAAKAEKERPYKQAKIETPSVSLSPREWDEEAWLLNELARIGLPLGSDAIPTIQQQKSYEAEANMQDQLPEGEETTGEILSLPAPKGELELTTGTSFPKYTHRGPHGQDNPEVFPDNRSTRKQGIVETAPVLGHTTSRGERTIVQLPETPWTNTPVSWKN